jgi:hypothetical protein
VVHVPLARPQLTPEERARALELLRRSQATLLDAVAFHNLRHNAQVADVIAAPGFPPA